MYCVAHILLLVAACSGGKGDSGIERTKAETETLSEIACAAYSSTTCNYIAGICQQELYDSYLSDTATTGYQPYNEWLEACQVEVQDWCVEHVKENYDDLKFVIQRVCQNGHDVYNLALEDRWESLSCDEITNDDLSIDFDYYEWCPCLEDGRVRQLGNEQYTCYQN